MPSTDKAYDAEKEAEAKEKTKQALVEAFEASHAAAVKGKTAALHCTLHRPTGMVSQEGEGEGERETEGGREGETDWVLPHCPSYNEGGRYRYQRLISSRLQTILYLC